VKYNELENKNAIDYTIGIWSYDWISRNYANNNTLGIINE
jgi:hypothetical protein